MTEIVLNYVHKIQGLDKCLPICAELKRRRRAHVVTIIDLEDTAENKDLQSFAALIGIGSDVVLEPRKPAAPAGGFAGYLSRWGGDEHARAFGRLARSIDRHVAALGRGPRRHILLTIFNGVKRPLGMRLAELVRARGGVRLGYLKSLHDQGRGLSDIDAELASRSMIRVAPHLDALLVPDHHGFQRLMERLGVGMHAQIVSGYPISYPEWKRLVQALPVCRAFSDDRRQLEVVVFTRGEVAHKDSSAQIISDRWLAGALEDILAELRATGKDVRLRIKPHPYQNLAPLRSFVAAAPEASLTDWPPVMLAATSDLAIATYSSAILDAVAMGVPALEYFTENDAFRRLHPGGSPFGGFGVTIARTRSELRQAIETLAADAADRFDLGAALGDRFDEPALDALLGACQGAAAE